MGVATDPERNLPQVTFPLYITIKILKEYSMEYSNCCDAPFGIPGWPDCDICSACGEHAEPSEEDEQ